MIKTLQVQLAILGVIPSHNVYADRNLFKHIFK